MNSGNFFWLHVSYVSSCRGITAGFGDAHQDAAGEYADTEGYTYCVKGEAKVQGIEEAGAGCSDETAGQSEGRKEALYPGTRTCH